MNSCHCNSKSFWKRNLNLTGYSSLQWSFPCLLITDLLHIVIILEHNYDIRIVTWKHKSSLNNYVSRFLFLGISCWFFILQSCFFSWPHFLSPCEIALSMQRVQEQNTLLSCTCKAPQSPWSGHRELPQNTFFRTVRLECFSHPVEVVLTGHCSLVGVIPFLLSGTSTASLELALTSCPSVTSGTAQHQEYPTPATMQEPVWVFDSFGCPGTLQCPRGSSGAWRGGGKWGRATGRQLWHSPLSLWGWQATFWFVPLQGMGKTNDISAR